MTEVDGHAWLADRFGEPLEVLQFRPRRFGDAPQDDAILIEVSAVGVGLPDLFMTKGGYPLVPVPPISPGQEACGRVLRAPGDSGLEIGDRVFGPTLFHAGFGGFATHAFLHPGVTTRAPESLSDEEAAGFYIGYRTAYTALVARAALRDGESVLVLGGAGSSGATAIQLAKALGAHVVAVASSEPKRGLCHALGADVVIERDAEAIQQAAADHTASRGFDVVIDPVGGAIGAAALATVARYGRFAVVGYASGSWTRLDPVDMVMRNYSVVGVLAAGFTQEEDSAHLGRLAALADAGKLRTPIGRVATLEEVPQVIASLEAGEVPGKLVVRVA